MRETATTDFIESNTDGALPGENAIALASAETERTLGQIEIEDHRWRIKARKRYGCVFVSLLIIQNIIVFGLVVWAFYSDRLKDGSVVFTLIVNGTLIETAYIIKIIVQWLFSDINYHKENP